MDKGTLSATLCPCPHRAGTYLPPAITHTSRSPPGRTFSSRARCRRAVCCRIEVTFKLRVGGSPPQEACFHFPPLNHCSPPTLSALYSESSPCTTLPRLEAPGMYPLSHITLVIPLHTHATIEKLAGRNTKI